MMQHNNTANTHRSLRALAIISTSTKWWGGPLIRVCSLIRSNTVYEKQSYRRNKLHISQIVESNVINPFDSHTGYNVGLVFSSIVHSGFLFVHEG